MNCASTPASAKRWRGASRMGPGGIVTGLGRFRQGHGIAALGQPQAHVAEPGADVQYPQRAFRQRLLEVGLEHGQTDGALGAAVDFLGEAGGEFVEVPVIPRVGVRGRVRRQSHDTKRLSLSASLARTAWSMSMPSSAHISRR